MVTGGLRDDLKHLIYEAKRESTHDSRRINVVLYSDSIVYIQ